MIPQLPHDILDLILEATNVNDILNASKANRNFYHLAQRHIRRKYKAEFADVDLSDIDPKTHGSAYQFLVKLLADKRIAHYVTAIYLKDWLETQTAAWYYDLPPIEWSSRERKDKCTYNEYKPDVCVTHHHKKHEDRGIVAAKYSRFDGLLGSIKSFDLSKPDRRVEHGVSGQKLAVHISWLNKIKAALHREDDDAGFALMLHLLPNIEEIYISYPGSLYFTRELLNPFLEGCSSWFPNLGHPILTNLQTVSVIGNCQSRYGGNESPDSVFDSTLDHDGHIKSLIKFPSVRNVEIKSINELNDISSFMSEQIACYSVVDCVAHELDPPIQLIHPGLEEFIWEPRAGVHGSWTSANDMVRELVEQSSASIKRLRIGSCCDGYGSRRSIRDFPLKQLTALEILDIDTVQLLGNNGHASALVDTMPESIKMVRIKEIPDVDEVDNLFRSFARLRGTNLPNLEKVIVSSESEPALQQFQHAVEMAGINWTIIEMKNDWHPFQDS